MICPRCSTEFTQGPPACPECGVQLLRSVSGVMKTSAVLIASGGEKGFYRSVQEVPEPLRARLIEVTNSSNSGTIVIADRAGKEQMTQLTARRESAPEVEPQVCSAPAVQHRLAGLRWTYWTGALLLLVAAAIIAAALVVR